VRFSPSDLTQLVDLLAYVLSAATDLAPESERTRLSELSERVGTGLPSWLSPLLWLRIPGLHRELLTEISGIDPVDDVAHFSSMAPSRIGCMSTIGVKPTISGKASTPLAACPARPSSCEGRHALYPVRIKGLRRILRRDREVRIH